MSKRRAVPILACILVIAGIMLILIGPVKTLIREYYENQAISDIQDAIRQGSGPVEYRVPVTDALSVEGEDGEQEYAFRDLAIDMQDLSAQYETLNLIALIEIPCLDIEAPVFDEVTRVSLRYGAGVFPGTAGIGNPGLTSIWGHRIQKVFKELQYADECIGETVVVTTADGIPHYYKIVETLYATDGDIMPYMDSRTYKTEMLAILTCGYGENHNGTYHSWNTEFVVICEPCVAP